MRPTVLKAAFFWLISGACSDASPVILPGAYVLRSVGNRPLPHTLYTGAGLTVATISASVTLLADSSFVHVRQYRISAAGDAPVTQSDTATGVFSLAGDKMDFTTPDGDVYQMVWQGVHLTHYAEGFTFRYRK